MCSSHFFRVRVTHALSQSHLKFFPVESKSSHDLVESSHDLVESSQRRVTRTVESLQVIGLQARVMVKSNEISHFFYDFFML